MGPDALCYDMALHIINAHPNASVSPVDLGYTIQAHIDNNVVDFLAGQFNCNDFAAAILLEHPMQMYGTDEVLLALTIQDFCDKVRTGDSESE